MITNFMKAKIIEKYNELKSNSLSDKGIIGSLCNDANKHFIIFTGEEYNMILSIIINILDRKGIKCNYTSFEQINCIDFICAREDAITYIDFLLDYSIGFSNTVAKVNEDILNMSKNIVDNNTVEYFLKLPRYSINETWEKICLNCATKYGVTISSEKIDSNGICNTRIRICGNKELVEYLDLILSIVDETSLSIADFNVQGLKKELDLIVVDNEVEHVSANIFGSGSKKYMFINDGVVETNVCDIIKSHTLKENLCVVDSSQKPEYVKLFNVIDACQKGKGVFKVTLEINGVSKSYRISLDELGEVLNNFTEMRKGIITISIC